MSAYLSGKMPEAWELQLHIMFISLSKKSVKEPEQHWGRVAEIGGIGHEAQIHLITYTELIRHWVVFKTYDQVTSTDTIYKTDSLLGDKPSFVI